jgi:hypothetical protein
VQQRWSRRLGALAALLTCALATASCGGGGGGQLAEHDGAASTTAPARNAPIPSTRLASPRTARAAAHELSRVEIGLRGDDRGAEHLAALGRRQQLAYLAIAAHPAWARAVVARVPSRVREAVRDNIAAERELAALTGGGSPASTVPDWQVLPPRPARELLADYRAAERETGIDWSYLAAIHLVESAMGRIHGTSSAGAQGPMQFLPSTWAEVGQGDITVDHDAILAAGRYLVRRGGPADMARALRGYNDDARYVAAVEAYARVMQADARAYDGYHAWQVFFRTDHGKFLLPEGYGAP